MKTWLWITVLWLVVPAWGSEMEIPDEVVESPPREELPSLTPEEIAAQTKKGKQLLEVARRTFNGRNYQGTLDAVQGLRALTLKPNPYLLEGEELEKKARVLQSQEVDPFLAQGKDLLKSGDFSGAREVCGEVLQTEPTRQEAATCVADATRGEQDQAAQTSWWERLKTYVMERVR